MRNQRAADLKGLLRNGPEYSTGRRLETTLIFAAMTFITVS